MAQRKQGNLKQRISDIAAIAASCPERFQDRCFELLLEELLAERRGDETKDSSRDTAATAALKDPDESDGTQQEVIPSPPVDTSADLVESDLHVKARSFMNKHNLTMADINQVVYRQDGEILPLYDDLGTTQMSLSQMRVAMLAGFRRGLDSGNFDFDGEQVRDECQTRKCYDRSNFTANFRTNAELFDGFEKYDKASPIIRLSTEGKKQLADLVRELI